MRVRLILALVAVAAIAFGGIRLAAADACGDARSVDALLADCHGALPLAQASVDRVEDGRLEEAARLADAAARRQPEDYVSWLAVAGVRAAQGDAAGAARARERARQLNPLR
jgi:cytochrome c-type biogenesis protein CcmH/NrfG